MRVFGNKLELVEYKMKRESCVAIFDTKGYIGILEMDGVKVLPSCLVENLSVENSRIQIQDYIYSEYGIEMNHVELVDKTVSFVNENDNYKLIASYYRGQIKGEIRINSTLKWLSPGNAIEELTYGSHAWIIRQIIENLIDL